MCQDDGTRLWSFSVLFLNNRINPPPCGNIWGLYCLIGDIHTSADLRRLSGIGFYERAAFNTDCKDDIPGRFIPFLCFLVYPILLPILDHVQSSCVGEP